MTFTRAPAAPTKEKYGALLLAVFWVTLGTKGHDVQCNVFAHGAVYLFLCSVRIVDWQYSVHL